jgi:hypothetical protein
VHTNTVQGGHVVNGLYELSRKVDHLSEKMDYLTELVHNYITAQPFSTATAPSPTTHTHVPVGGSSNSAAGSGSSSSNAGGIVYTPAEYTAPSTTLPAALAQSTLKGLHVRQVFFNFYKDGWYNIRCVDNASEAKAISRIFRLILMLRVFLPEGARLTRSNAVETAEELPAWTATLHEYALHVTEMALQFLKNNKQLYAKPTTDPKTAQKRNRAHTPLCSSVAKDLAHLRKHHLSLFPVPVDVVDRAFPTQTDESGQVTALQPEPGD